MKSPKKGSGRPGRQPMVDKQQAFAVMLRQGVSISEACRRLSIDRKTGHFWKNGRTVHRNGVVVRVAPTVSRHEQPEPSPRFLSLEERCVIADGVRAGRSARAIAAELGRAVSTVAREIKRNANAGEYRPHAAQATMLARRPRPKTRLLESDPVPRALVQGYLDQRWSPEQVVQKLLRSHARRIAVEKVYQALYSPQRVVQREPSAVLRSGRPYRRPRRRGD